MLPVPSSLFPGVCTQRLFGTVLSALQSWCGRTVPQQQGSISSQAIFAHISASARVMIIPLLSQRSDCWGTVLPCRLRRTGRTVPYSAPMILLLMRTVLWEMSSLRHEGQYADAVWVRGLLSAGGLSPFGGRCGCRPFGHALFPPVGCVRGARPFQDLAPKPAGSGAASR